MAWRIEYTNHALKKNRKKILEKAVAESIEEIKRLLQQEQDGGFIFGEIGFFVESRWLPDLKKYHVALCGSERNRWIASLVFEDYPTMSVEEVKNTLRRMGFAEHSIHALGVTNEKTVAALLREIEDKLKSETDEFVKQILLIDKTSIETFLEKGIIQMNDGLLDAFRKIEALC